MKNNILSILGAILLLAGAIAAADTPTNYQKIFDSVDPYMVTVEYKAEMNFMGQTEDIEGRVPGIIVDNYMVIFDGTSLGAGDGGNDMFGGVRVDKPKSIKITDRNDKTYDAEFIGVDDYSSIAFCRLPDSARANLKPANFKQVDPKLGQQVFIFWMLPKTYQPRFQMTHTYITAVLTKPEKFYLTGELTPDFILAPVVTADGDLIGVISPVSQPSSMMQFDYGNVFGIPVGIMPLDQFKKMLDNPPEPDKFKRGWLGVSLQALDPEIASFWNVDVPGGIILTEIMDNSPAAKAGLKAGDFLIQLNGEPIEVTQDENLSVFQKKVSELGAGATIQLTYLRPDKETVDTGEVALVLAQRPTSAGDAPTYEDKNYDLTVRDLVFADYNNRSLKEGEIQGVIVDKIEQGGWAEVGGIDPGVIIMRINDSRIESVEDFKQVMARIENDRDKETVFMIWRSNKTQFVHVKTHWE